MVFAQIPGADRVLEVASATNRYEAVLLVFLILGIASLFAYFLRGDKNEQRQTQKFIRTTMADVIDANTIILGRFIHVLGDRPCVATDSDMKRLAAGNDTKVTDDEARELDEVTKKAIARVKRRARRRGIDEDDAEDTPE